MDRSRKQGPSVRYQPVPRSRAPRSGPRPDSLWSIPPGGLDMLDEPEPGDERAGATLTEPLGSGMGLVCWRAKTPEGTGVTVHMLEPGASRALRASFVARAAEMQQTLHARPIEGVPAIVAVDPLECAYVSLRDAAATAADVPSLSFTVEQQVNLVREICLILARVHEAKLVHGCLRPEAVLLDAAQCPALVHVQAVDVAAACREDPAAAVARSPYVAPEVRLGEKVNARADVFSVGRLIHYLLLGSEPEDDAEQLPALTSLSEASSGLVRIVRRCTARDPADRYPNAVSVVADVDRWIDGGEVGLGHPAVVERYDVVRHAMARRRQQAEGHGSAARPPPELPAHPKAEGRAPAVGPSRDGRHHRGQPTLEELAKEALADLPDEPESEQERVLEPGGTQLPEAEEQPPAPTQPLGVELPSPSARWSPRIALPCAAVGLVLSGAAAFACYRSGSILPWADAASVGGAGILSGALPGFGPRRILGRALAAVLLVAIAVFVRPPAIAAARGDPAAGLRSGGPAQKVAALRALKAQGRTDLVKLDLAGADLGDLDLRDAVLDGSTLHGAKCVGIDFEGASMLNVDVGEADLSGAHLPDVNVIQLVGWSESVCDAATEMPPGWTCQAGHPASAAAKDGDKEGN